MLRQPTTLAPPCPHKPPPSRPPEGAKKVQQDLARPGVLECFAPSASDAAAMRETFAGLWGLDDTVGSPGEASGHMCVQRRAGARVETARGALSCKPVACCEGGFSAQGSKVQDMLSTRLRF